MSAGRHKGISEVQRYYLSAVLLEFACKQVGKFCSVDVAAGDNADDLSSAGFA
jgi:hypothetical protein